MKFTTRIKINGMKASKGDYEGTAYDSTKVYVEVGLDDSKGMAKGTAGGEYTLGKSDEYEKFKHLPFPFLADCEMEMVTTGKEQRTLMRTCVPVELVKKAA